MTIRQARYLKQALAGIGTAGAVGGAIAYRRHVTDPSKAPPPPENFRMRLDLGGGLSAERNGPYATVQEHMTPRLQAYVRRNPKKPVYIKPSKGGKYDKAMSPTQKALLGYGSLVGASALVATHPHWLMKRPQPGNFGPPPRY